jgi:replicative DNA helicase
MGVMLAGEGRDTFRDLHAETCVIGAVLRNNDAIAIAAERLTPEDFSRHAHGMIFEAMLRLWQTRRPIDVMTVLDALGPKVEECGGASYIVRTIDDVPRSTNIDAYADIVKERSTRREMQRAVLQAKAAVEDPGLSVSEAAEVVLSTMQRSTPKPEMAFASKYASDFRSWVEDDEGREAGKVFTGIPTLDAIHRGGLPVGAHILGGRTSQGKSALMLSIAHYVGMGDMAEPVLINTGEMDTRQMMGRLVALHGRLEGEAIVSGDLQYVPRRELMKAIDDIEKQSRITFIDRKLTPSQLRAAAIRHHAEHGLRLLVTDYVGIMPADPKMRRKSANRQQELGYMMRVYKSIADELQIPHLVLAQLSRNATTKKFPTLEDLRESGDLEQDAHVVWLLHRPIGQTEGKIIVAKNRNGRTGVADVYFDGPSMRYYGADTMSQAARYTGGSTTGDDDDSGY